MLRLLDAPRGIAPFATFDELKDEWLPGVGDRFKQLGLLREIEAARTIVLGECEQQPCVEPFWRVSQQTGKLQGVYCCGDDECAGIHYIDPERMRQWAFTLEVVAAAVAKAIGVSGSIAVDVPNYSYFIGTVATGTGVREVFVTRSPWWKYNPEVGAPGSRLAAASNATLLCVNAMPPVEQRMPSWRAVLSLQEIASMGDARLIVPHERVLEDQRPPATPAALDDTTALTQAEVDVLEALAEQPKEPQLIAQLVAASGYGRDTVIETVKRLAAYGMVTRPEGSRRKGVFITTSGVQRVGRLPKSE